MIRGLFQKFGMCLLNGLTVQSCNMSIHRPGFCSIKAMWSTGVIYRGSYRGGYRGDGPPLHNYLRHCMNATIEKFIISLIQHISNFRFFFFSLFIFVIIVECLYNPLEISTFKNYNVLENNPFIIEYLIFFSNCKNG